MRTRLIPLYQQNGEIMKQKILEHLKQLEQEQDIKILLASETGSRGWGFHSPDSDYDVRLIYMHQKDWYLSLSEKKDSIELMLENRDLDISGWDLRKTLRLLAKSNAALLERIQSPIIYIADDSFLKSINLLAKKHYSRIGTLYHYISVCKKSLEDVKGKDSYKLKRLFYALRSAAVCQWILSKENNPPIEFLKVLEGISMDESLRAKIEALIKVKMKENETYFHNGESEIINFIEASLSKAESKANSLPSGNGNMEQLNAFFINTLA